MCLTCHLPRGIQRQDSVPGAVGPTEEDAPRGAEEDLRNVLLGRERGQDPLRPVHRGGDTQQYVAGICPSSTNLGHSAPPVTHPCLFDLPVAEGPYTEVVKLQTMRCLFEAYEHVLSLLENVFTPMFCHSDEVSVLARK